MRCVVRESLDFTRNMFWLVSCFSKRKKLSSHFFRKSTWDCRCLQLTFPPQQKNWHNSTTVLYTKYVRSFKNYFPPEIKKLTQNHNCMVGCPKYISSMWNQNLFPTRTGNWHNSTTGGKGLPAHAKRMYLTLRPSVCL